MSSPFSLKGYYVTHFLGAFNDNAWKMVLVFVASRTVQDSSTAEKFFQTRMTEATMALTLPFILCSLPATLFVDRFSKRFLTILLKGMELLLMCLGTFLLATAPDTFTPLLWVLILMGLQSALLSPVKYGYLPEAVSKKQLPQANALLEMWTMLAIIFGITSGGFLYDAFEVHLFGAGGVLIALAFLGWRASLTIPETAPKSGLESSGNTFWQAAHLIRQKKSLMGIILVLSLFWALATLLQQNALTHLKTVLGKSASLSSLALGVCGIGIAVGSLVMGKISTYRNELGCISLGFLGLIFGITGLSLFPHSYELILLSMLSLGFFGGFILVPCHTHLQETPPRHICGSVIALGNIIVFSGITAGTFMSGVLSQVGFETVNIFFLSILACSVIFLGSFCLLLYDFLRSLALFFQKLFYRFEISEIGRIPPDEGVLLICNHVSYLDWMFILLACDRPVRFVIDKNFYDFFLFKPFLKIAGAIPISSSPGDIRRAFGNIEQCLKNRELICLFPEGTITRTGTMGDFQRGLKIILRHQQAPVIPLYLDNLWGRRLSYSGGSLWKTSNASVPDPVRLIIGPPLSPKMPLEDLRKTVKSLKNSDNSSP